MKNTSYTQCILCQGKDLAESVRIFNEEMQKHCKDSVTYERYDDFFLIYVKCTEMIPENVVEQHELQRRAVRIHDKVGQAVQPDIFAVHKDMGYG